MVQRILTRCSSTQMILPNCPVTAPPVYYLTCGDNYPRKILKNKDLGLDLQFGGSLKS
jgi:hypothetical protein